MVFGPNNLTDAEVMASAKYKQLLAHFEKAGLAATEELAAVEDDHKAEVLDLERSFQTMLCGLGWTTRDQFATACLTTGLLPDMIAEKLFDHHGDDWPPAEYAGAIAGWSYTMAGAMVAERTRLIGQETPVTDSDLNVRDRMRRALQLARELGKDQGYRGDEGFVLVLKNPGSIEAAEALMQKRGYRALDEDD